MNTLSPATRPRFCRACGGQFPRFERRCRECSVFDLTKLSGRLDHSIALSGQMLKNVAVDAGLSTGYVSSLRTGDELNPTLRTVERLAEALAVSPGWLAFGDES